jgi:hypothetical protein
MQKRGYFADVDSGYESGVLSLFFVKLSSFAQPSLRLQGCLGNGINRFWLHHQKAYQTVIGEIE